VIPYLEIDSEWWWIRQRSTSAPKRTESSSSLLYSLLAATIVTDTKGERVVEKHAGDHSDQAFVDRSSSKGFRSELQFYTKTCMTRYGNRWRRSAAYSLDDHSWIQLSGLRSKFPPPREIQTKGNYESSKMIHEHTRIHADLREANNTQHPNNTSNCKKTGRDWWFLQTGHYTTTAATTTTEHIF
jgi:hypothetical protein